MSDCDLDDDDDFGGLGWEQGDSVVEPEDVDFVIDWRGWQRPEVGSRHGQQGDALDELVDQGLEY